jgi:hypothetical protein
MMKHDEAHKRAYCRAGAKLGFYFHLVAYITVNLLLVFVNYSTSPQYLWFKWPLFGWGIGLLFHWFAVFVGPKLMQHFVKRELEKNGLGN